MTDAVLADDLVREVFGAWLKASTLHGCMFAAWATKERINYAAYFDEPTADLVPLINDHVRIAAEQQRLALAVFPGIDAEAGVVELVNALTADSCWLWQRSPLENRLAIDLRWAIDGQPQCSAIGFAPFGAMPLTRRAPYVALGIWPGGRENRRRKKPHEFVGVGDMSHSIDDATYDHMNKVTRDRVSAFRDVLDAAGVVTGITFCLSLAEESRIVPTATNARP